MSEGNGKETTVQPAMREVVVSPHAAIEEVFREHHGRVFRTAWRITGNAGDAEDVLQTVFLRLLDRRAGEPVAEMGAYLHRAAVNAALDLLRSRQKSQGVPLEAVQGVLPGDARLQPDRRHSAGELRAFLRQAIARLSPKTAEMFVLRYFEGYENPEIARMLETTAANVAVTLHRTRGRLQEEIRSFYGDVS